MLNSSFINFQIDPDKNYGIILSLKFNDDILALLKKKIKKKNRTAITGRIGHLIYKMNLQNILNCKICLHTINTDTSFKYQKF